MKRLWIFLILVTSLVLIVPAVSAKTMIINSRDWKDIYSGLVYSKKLGIPVLFFTSELDSAIVQKRIGGKETELLLIESREVPFVFDYRDTLISKGYDIASITGTEDYPVNLQIADKVGSSNFIVVDDSRGYNALVVAPYAHLTDSVVLIAHGDDDRIKQFLNRKRVDSLLIYGNVDPQLYRYLDRYKPDVINEGDKFLDNMELVSRFLDLRPETRQALFIAGDVIEKGIVFSENPVILISKENTPKQLIDFLVNSPIDVAEVVGNDLAEPARILRRKIELSKGFSVFLKFGQTDPGRSEKIGSIVVLDTYKVPVPKYNLSIRSMRYNLISKKFELLLENNEGSVTNFKATITIRSGEELIRTIGDFEPRTIPPYAVRGYTYDLNLSGEDIGRLSATVYIQYGDGTISLTEGLRKSVSNIETLEMADRSSGKISEVDYEPSNRRFKVTVKNTGEVPFFYDVSLYFGAYGEQISLNETRYLDRDSEEIYLDYELTAETMKDIKNVVVKLEYGERKNFLLNEFEKEFEIEIPQKINWILIVFIVAIAALIFLYKRSQ